MVVNHKKVRRLMREHDLQPRMRRRFTTTTDSNHDQPIFPNLAKNIVLNGPTSSGSPTSPTSPLSAASSLLPSFWMPGPGASWAMPSAVPSTLC
ncbi:IS3 family transposase [Bradyrhizobium sp. I1.7.5]|uniref:IS3 family transposase n=1 Tax=Bradyrhizobium sp. I1.7.5 TaxID=3156363 RepID=UPI0033964F14